MIWFTQFDFIVLFISTLQKLILRYVNAIPSDMFSLSFKNLVISHQNGCILEHSQNKWILDSVEELQKSHKLDSIMPYLKSFSLFGTMCIKYLYWKLRSLVSIVVLKIWLNIFFQSSADESLSSHFVSWPYWVFVIFSRRML